MNSFDLESLKVFLRTTLEARTVVGPLEEIIRDRTSKAGTQHEEVFTREFLCPTIATFFYEMAGPHLNLSEDVIRSGLGTEGYQNCPGFGFTPARHERHLFTKSDIIKSDPPKSWLTATTAPLPSFRACPDFAISKPLLPCSVVGEVKYFKKSGKPDTVLKELYNAARQAVFYLGAFHGVYDSAMVIIADASKGHTFLSGMQEVRPELIERFVAQKREFTLCQSSCSSQTHSLTASSGSPKLPAPADAGFRGPAFRELSR